MEFTGYHGTGISAIRSISKYGLNPSKSGWLGGGIYLYENDYDMAYKWAKSRNKNVAVYECLINIEDDKLFDVSCPTSDDCKIFHRTRLKIIEKAQETGVLLEERARVFDAKVFNLLYERFKFELIKANTVSIFPDKDFRTFTRIPNGTELCLKDSSKIKEMTINTGKE